MRTLRARAGALLTAAVAGSLLLAGCSAGSAPADAGASAPAVIAPANSTEFGLPAGSGPVEIGLWTDLSCPHCQSLEEIMGPDLQQWVADGDVSLTIHPLNFVSAKRGDATEWSTRAANALAAVADAGEADRLPAFYALLQEHQVTSDGALTDDEIVALASQAGVTADISDAVASQRFGAWVSASNEHWLGRTIGGTEQVVQGVPILVIDGAVFEIRGDGTDAQRIRDAVATAIAA
ncbi:DsbA family protein [Microbacterium ulmi]|uniref:Thioredoxin domain-containing protein n=1 Tax=Microbacterium ulmi TaxID=179095 RepID=A0A7Y2LYH1_9MICO|nr:thioredoxin domain-containing protein [Microbacterium ulmi]NII68389.1 protein-disulfide isomerase [Microbacterium ulmi]NNH03080.1 thioredoxin domain-containing protein [Microbacterium ulmi]